MRIGGDEIEARTIAGAGDVTLVFLHEGLGSVSLWREFPDQVAAALGLPALVYSRRGYGGSSPITLPRPTRFMHDEAAYLRSVLEGAGVRRALLVGHSDGASIALLHAALHPPDLVGVVAMAPHVFVEDLSIANIAKAKVAYETTDLRKRLERHHGANVDIAFRGWNDVWLRPDFRSWNIEREVASIAVPCAVIQGRDDAYGTLAQVEAIRTHVPGTKVTVIDACGHSPHKDQPAATLAAIVEFVKWATNERSPAY